MKGYSESKQTDMNALKAFMGYNYPRDNKQDAVTDMVTDMLHLAHQSGVNVHSLLSRVESHFNEESDEADGKLERAEEYWYQLADLPFDESERLEQDFEGFEVGTSKYDIWAWIEQEFDVSIAVDLMG